MHITSKDNGVSFITFRVETQDGGDAKVEVSPRDIVYTQPAEPLENEEPEILHKLDLRYGYEVNDHRSSRIKTLT